MSEEFKPHITITFHCSTTHRIEFNVLRNIDNHQPDLTSVENLSAIVRRIAEKLNEDKPEDWGNYLNRIFYECNAKSICEVSNGPQPNVEPSAN